MRDMPEEKKKGADILPLAFNGRQRTTTLMLPLIFFLLASIPYLLLSINFVLRQWLKFCKEIGRVEKTVPFFKSSKSVKEG